MLKNEKIKANPLKKSEKSHTIKFCKKKITTFQQMITKTILAVQKYKEMDIKSKELFFSKFLEQKIDKNDVNNMLIIDYFNKYEAFCFDLEHDSVLQGELNFNFK